MVAIDHQRARAELKAFERLIAELPVSNERNSPRDILTYGYLVAVPDVSYRFHQIVQEELENTSKEVLNFREWTSFSTWFRKHPEKVAGPWMVTTSIHFPIEIKSTKESIIRCIAGAKTTQNKGQARLIRLRMKAKAIKVKLKLQNKSLGSLEGLGRLHKSTEKLISRNKYRMPKLLGLKGLSGLSGDNKLYSFDDIDKEYNSAISLEEKKAWVWYKRKLKEPMKGWDKYYIDGSKDQLTKLVKAGALYYSDGELLPYPIFKFGNMYDRELQLEKDKEEIIKTYGTEVFERHQKEIQEAKPKPLSVMNPDPRERPKILSFSKMSKQFFVSELREEVGIELNTKSKYQGANEDGTMSLLWAFGHWLIKLPEHEFQNVSAYDMWNYYVQNGRVPKHYSDSKKQTIEKYGPQECEVLFSKFLNSALTVEDQQKLDMLWNRTYNGFSSIPYHRIPIGFECSAKFKGFDFAFTRIQREGVSFMKSAGSGIIAYDVGVGKTITAIIALLNDLYSGKCKRPLVVVPNATYLKWVREIFGYEDEKTKKFIEGVASHTGIELNDWYNLGTSVIKRISKSKDEVDLDPPKAGSITVVTYEGLAKMGYSQKAMQEFFEELSQILAQTDDSDRSQRDLEKKYQKWRELIGTGNKGTIIDFDQLGFDYLVIDEAHNFRNVFAYVPQDDEGNKRFQISGAESARAQKAFFICNFVQRMFGSNVMLLTATPFTNNPVEIYSMTSLVGYQNMRDMGISNLYDFMELFINQSMEWVNSYNGTIVQRPVVKAFNNRLILQKLIYNHISYKTGEEAGVKRPCKINLPKTTYQDDETGMTRRLPIEDQIITYLEMTETQKENQAEIIALAQRPGQSIAERLANIMRALARSLDNALSPFLYDPTPLNEGLAEDKFRRFVEESPKIKYVIDCVKSVKKHHEDKGEPVSGQVIYSNRGKDYFDFIKKYLEDVVGYQRNIKFQGGKVDEVEILTSGVSQTYREKVKDAFLAGVCKIIIGTATIREGIDLQKFGTVLYNMYPDWNPTDVKQLEGRIWRQGNNFGYVRVVMPLVQDSMDVFVFQKLEEKTSRVNDIWYRADRGNVLDVEALDPEEVKFALYTNLSELAKIVIEKEERELDRKAKVIEADIDAIKRLDHAIRKRDEFRAECIDAFRDWLEVFSNFGNQAEHFGTRWGATPKEMEGHIDRAMEYAGELQKFLEETAPTDKELLTLARRIQQTVFASRYAIDAKRYTFDMFKDFSLQVAKAEKTTLLEKGLTIDTDFQNLIEELTKDRAKIYEDIEILRSPENLESIIADIARKKAENKVEGRSAEMAAEDFIGLNYLLDYKFQDVDTTACEIPHLAEKGPKNPERAVDVQKLEIPVLVKKFLPEHQRKILTWEHQDLMDNLDQIAKAIPNLYATDKAYSKFKKDHPSFYNVHSNKNLLQHIATAYLHYFVGATDIYVCEVDWDERLFYTYTILNGDVEMAEFGYSSIDELQKTVPLELDFHFTPGQLSRYMYRLDPDYYDEPLELPTGEEPKKSNSLKLKLKLRAKAIKIKLKLKSAA